MFKSFVGGYAAASKRALDALAEAIECHVGRHHYEGLAKPDEQNFTPLGKLMQLAIAGRNRDVPFSPNRVASMCRAAARMIGEIPF